MVSIMAAQKRTSVQNAVVITDRVANMESIEHYAQKIFSQLEVGKKFSGQGLLYVFFPARKQLKIEVSYAMEGDLPDASIRLLEEAAKTFVYTRRYHDFWAELINTLNIQIQQNRKGVEPTMGFNNFKDFVYLSGGAGLTKTDYEATAEQLLSEINQLPAEQVQKYKPQKSISATLDLYLQSLHEGIYDLNLPLLHSSSRIFRVFTPMNRSQLLRNFFMYQKAGLDQIFVFQNKAVVFFKELIPVLPLIFHRNDQGLWLVHEPQSWALFHRFEDSNRIFLKFPLTSSDRNFNAYLRQRFGRALYHTYPAIHFSEELTSETSWKQDFFEYYWLEKVARSVLGNESVAAEVELDTWMNLGQFSNFLKAHRRLAHQYPEDEVIKVNMKFYEDNLKFDSKEWRKNF